MESERTRVSDSCSACSALSGLPPFLRSGEYDTEALQSTSTNLSSLNERSEGAVAQPVLSQLVVLANEMLSDIHGGRINTAASDYVLDSEAKWAKWSEMCKEDVLRLRHRWGSALVNIHYHW